MADERLARVPPEHEPDRAVGGARRRGRPHERGVDRLRERRVRAVGLRHHGAAGRDRGRGVAARDGEREREVRRPEHRDRADRHEEPADVRERSHRRVVSRIDDDLEMRSVTDHPREEPQLVDRPGQLAREPWAAERGLAVGELHERVAVLLQRVGHRLEEAGATLDSERGQARRGRDGGPDDGIDVGGGALGGDVLDRPAGAGVDGADGGDHGLRLSSDGRHRVCTV